ncbi:MAG: carboxymuconolactone decarboxylase family protein [Acidiferrobacterales bacterium]
MPITVKQKELTAVGISVAAGCKPCTNYHLKAVRKAGASDEEIKQAVADAVAVRERATQIMQAHALTRLGEAEQDSDPTPTEETNRMQVLVSIGAAFGVNCVTTLEKYLAAAETVGLSQDDIAEIVKLAAFIKDKAISHVERRVGLMEEEVV